MLVPRVFISYRRRDVDCAVDAIEDILHQKFSERGVFRDKSDMPPGCNWPEHIAREITRCTGVLAVIGPDWEYGPPTEAHRHDVFSDDDYINRELSLALNLDKRILPVLVDRDNPPQYGNFADTLASLGKCHSIAISSSQLESDLKKLFLWFDELAHNSVSRQKPFVFVSSTLTTGGGKSIDGLDYFCGLLGQIVSQAHSNPNDDLILKVPEYSTDHRDRFLLNQMRIVEEAWNNRSLYRALIIAPFSIPALYEKIRQLRADSGDYSFPIATIDKGFAAWPKEDLLPLQPVFSAENNGLYNGALAATALCYHFKEASIANPRILVLPGGEGSLPRVHGFIQKLKHLSGHFELRCSDRTLEDQLSHQLGMDKLSIKDCPRGLERRKIFVEVLPESQFTRESGKKLMEYYLTSESVNEERGQVPHAVFCCNDELALGARAALIGSDRVRTWPDPTVIMGFDGIGDITGLLEDGNEPFILNTVNVRIADQVSELFNLLNKWMRSAGTSEAISTHEQCGELYLKFHEQRKRTAEILALRIRPRSRRRGATAGA